MFERILFPTDFSEVAARGLDSIAKLQAAGVEEVVVLTVIDSLSVVHEGLRESSEAQCAEVAAQLKAAGVNARPLVRVGYPARVILDTAAEVGSTMIVIGSTGKGRFAELVLGSVSDEVVRSAHLPVLVVKPEPAPKAPVED